MVFRPGPPLLLFFHLWIKLNRIKNIFFWPKWYLLVVLHSSRVMSGFRYLVTSLMKDSATCQAISSCRSWVIKAADIRNRCSGSVTFLYGSGSFSCLSRCQQNASFFSQVYCQLTITYHKYIQISLRYFFRQILQLWKINRLLSCSYYRY